jgi:hypothetical protein
VPHNGCTRCRIAAGGYPRRKLHNRSIRPTGTAFDPDGGPQEFEVNPPSFPLLAFFAAVRFTAGFFVFFPAAFFLLLALVLRIAIGPSRCGRPQVRERVYCVDQYCAMHCRTIAMNNLRAPPGSILIIQGNRQGIGVRVDGSVLTRGGQPFGGPLVRPPHRAVSSAPGSFFE